ncbi:MAG: HNH endonuclease, partial [Deltaproteobacteria bacterium]|nr:HNH endonuclease [Deltaproteobacteria bacterium]
GGHAAGPRSAMSEKRLKIIGRVVPDGNGGIALPLSIGTGKEARLLTVPLTLSEAELTKQQREPVLAMEGTSWWLFRQVVVDVSAVGLLPAEHQEELLLRVKHLVLRHEKVLSRIRRDVDAFENLDRLPTARRETIPESVRMFVWQRDEGRCVKCGTHEKLEFDHVIPVADGGSSTDRNVQLLCEACNRAKGRSLR